MSETESGISGSSAGESPLAGGVMDKRVCPTCSCAAICLPIGVMAFYRKVNICKVCQGLYFEAPPKVTEWMGIYMSSGVFDPIPIKPACYTNWYIPRCVVAVKCRDCFTEEIHSDGEYMMKQKIAALGIPKEYLCGGNPSISAVLNVPSVASQLFVPLPVGKDSSKT